MAPPVISVRNLSKSYRLGTIGRHTLMDEAQYFWHKLRGRDPREHMTKIGHSATAQRMVETQRSGAEEFWALRDVSFDVQQGEVVGIIGRNGAGKSTLLKVLTRITEPTSGRAVIYGRVGSLLEVGTGFHPELTGRENIFMNGVILGMKKHEIASKFDEILAFSELEQFIDTPVKRYSSGMYVRLAFAVAAHLEPEILLIDEVLAVGDASFQQKCLGKMGEVSRAGRTILFVSHNMAAVQNLCSRCVWLKDGTFHKEGDSASVVAAYLRDAQTGAGAVYHRGDLEGNGSPYFERIQLLNSVGEAVDTLQMGEPAQLVAVVRGGAEGGRCVVGYSLFNDMGERLVAMNMGTMQNQGFELPAGKCVSVTCQIPSLNLMPGAYCFSAVIQTADHKNYTLAHLERPINFNIVPSDVFKTGRLPPGRSAFYWLADWQIGAVDGDSAQ